MGIFGHTPGSIYLYLYIYIYITKLEVGSPSPTRGSATPRLPGPQSSAPQSSAPTRASSSPTPPLRQSRHAPKGVLPTHGTCGHSMAGPDSFANPGFGQPVATLGTESCCPMVPNSQRRAEQIESRILPLSVGGPSEPPGGFRGPMVRDFRPSPPSGPALGAVLGAPWPVSGACRVVLGPSLDVRGPSWGPPGPSWAICGPSRAGVERREAQNGKVKILFKSVRTS